MSETAARVRAARAYAGITQQQLADRLETTTRTIKRRESGAASLKREDLLAHAAACGVPVSFFEHGFADVAPSEIAERLARIEAALAGDLEPVRTFVRHVTEQLADASDDATREPTSPRGRGPRRAARPAPPVPSRRRSGPTSATGQ